GTPTPGKKSRARSLWAEVKPGIAHAFAPVLGLLLLGLQPALPAWARSQAHFAITASVGGTYHPLTPARILDTRFSSKVGTGGTINVQIEGKGGVPATGVSAVVLNVTATDTTAPGFLIVFPQGVTMPLASNLNFVAGQTVPNLVTVGLGTTGQVSIYNGPGLTAVSPDVAGQTVPNRVMVGVSAAGKVSIYNGLASSHVIADVNGWFTDGTAGGTGSRFTPVTPTRVLDSRYGTGGYWTPWGPSSGRAVTVAGQAGVPLMTDPNPPTAVVANVTVTDTSQASALIAWPDGAAQPLASDLNWTAGVTVPNLVVAQVGPTGKVDLDNIFGCTDVVMDVVGWFTGPIPVITPAPPPSATPCPAPSGGGWLSRFNFYRASANLPNVTGNAVW